jgi:hypothetical protein
LFVFSVLSHFVLFIIFAFVKLLSLFIFMAYINGLLLFYHDKWITCVFLSHTCTRIFACTWRLPQPRPYSFGLGYDITVYRPLDFLFKPTQILKWSNELRIMLYDAAHQMIRIRNELGWDREDIYTLPSSPNN